MGESVWTFSFIYSCLNYNFVYISQVRLFYEQIRGLQDGYQGTPAQITMDVDDFLGI